MDFATPVSPGKSSLNILASFVSHSRGHYAADLRKVEQLQYFNNERIQKMALK